MAVAGLPKEEVSFQTTVRQPAQISQNLVADHINVQNDKHETSPLDSNSFCHPTKRKQSYNLFLAKPQEEKEMYLQHSKQMQPL